MQGGIYPDLRQESAERLVAMDFPGYAIGGLAVGEPKPLMYEIIEQVEPYLPEEKPRYLMGVGTPADLVEAVARGVDMFDCVMPTRHARNGWLFTRDGHIVIKTREVQRGSGADRCVMRLSGVPDVFAGVSEASFYRQRDPLFGAKYYS